MTIAPKKPIDRVQNIIELDAMVAEAISLFDDKKYSRVSGQNIWKLEEIEHVLLDNLEQTTNIQEAFAQAKLSYQRGKDGFNTVVHPLLSNLGRSRFKNNFLNLIKMLDGHYNSLRNKQLKKFVFYIPLRLELELNQSEEKKLKNQIKKTLELRLIKKLPKYISKQISGSNLVKLFTRRDLVLEASMNARDQQFVLDSLVNKNLDCLIGILAFANHYKRISRRWGVNPKNSLSDPPLERPDLFLIIENKKIIYPQNKSRLNIMNSQIEEEKIITSIGKQFWRIHNKANGNYQFIMELLKLVKSQAVSLQELSGHCFKLYFDAITETDLEMSFLKFWIISEKIIKSGGGMGDEKFVSILKKLTGNRYTKERIENLRKKRNLLVHEFLSNEISQEDRNLAKLVSEVTFVMYLDPKAKFDNLEEFQFLLENIFVEKNKLKKRQNILKKLFR